MPNDSQSKIRPYQMLINGAWVNASDGKTFDSINPANGEVWAQFAEATEADVEQAVTAAHEAFHQGPWPKMTPSERGRYLRRLAELLESESEELGKFEALDTGKMYVETQWQAKYIAEFFQFYAGCADKISGETLPIDKPDMFVFTSREPLGVVVAVVPWNSQLFLSAVKIAPALAAGNTMVLKASEHASAAVLEFGRLVERAGIPAGVFNIITGHGEPGGRVLTSHPLVSRISFTGGANAGRHILQNASNNFAQVSLEMGGKSPFIVFDDANLDDAVNGAIGAIFGAAGQSCVAGSRLYLHEKIATKFLAKMVEQANKIRLGDPFAKETEMGPLCTPAQLENIEREVAYAKEQGGKVLCGGSRPKGLSGGNENGIFYTPTIIECPRQDLQIMDVELFGPVLSVLRFKDEQEVIGFANDTTHGLGAGIFTVDGARALRVAKAIQAGIVWVNTYRAVSPIAEFGGMKNSGYGRESGFQAMYDYTRPKTVWVNTSSASTPLSSQMVTR